MKNTCFMCWVNSTEKPLIKIENNLVDSYVCTSCMPELIHWK